MISLTVNLGILAFFKYANFFQENFILLMESFGIHLHINSLNIILPVGISFYTFQTLSYTLDIYFGKIKPTKSLLKFLVFVAAFPQLVAGPIVRAKNFIPQLRTNLFYKSNHAGIFYILYGILKKLLIADVIGYILVDPVFNGSLTNFNSIELVIAAYGYAFQIFFDFSAYSDIAVGLGKIFGLELPINFKSPYSARNPGEFWRKWHITLSTWLKDYLYIPLGGSRVGQQKYIRNIIIVMLLGGLWHGASWTFIIWGGLHALFVILYATILSRWKFYERMPDMVKIFLFFNLTCLAWIFFRSPDVSFAFGYLSSILNFSFSGNGLQPLSAIGLLGLSFVVHFFVEPNLKKGSMVFARIHWGLQALVLYCILMAFYLLKENELLHKAFIYFQF